MTTSWAIGVVEISQRHGECVKRIEILLDYSEALYQSQLFRADDSLELSNLSQRVRQLLADAANDQELRRHVADGAKRIEKLMALVNNAGEQKSRRPEIAKLLSHFENLHRDVEKLLDDEIAMGREMAGVCEDVGGSEKFRALLQEECSIISWAKVEGAMKTAMDSALAAKLDKDEQQ